MKKDVKKILHEELKKIGKKGGLATMNRHGSAHFSKISKKGISARRKKSLATK